MVELGRSFTSMLGVLDAARAASVEKVVVLLPATVLYGNPSARQLPVQGGAITPPRGRGVVAKAIVDLLTAYREEHGIEFTALAATTVYGPRQRVQRGAVADCSDAAANGEPARLTGDGRQTRDFVLRRRRRRRRGPSASRGERTGRQRRHRRADLAA